MARRLVLHLSVTFGHQLLDPGQFRSMLASDALERLRGVGPDRLRFFASIRQGPQLFLTGGKRPPKRIALDIGCSELCSRLGQSGLVDSPIPSELFGEARLDLAHPLRQAGGLIQEGLPSLLLGGARTREIALDGLARGNFLGHLRVELRLEFGRVRRRRRALGERGLCFAQLPGDDLAICRRLGQAGFVLPLPFGEIRRRRLHRRRVLAFDGAELVLERRLRSRSLRQSRRVLRLLLRELGRRRRQLRRPQLLDVAKRRFAIRQPLPSLRQGLLQDVASNHLPGEPRVELELPLCGVLHRSEAFTLRALLRNLKGDCLLGQSAFEQCRPCGGLCERGLALREPIGGRGRLCRAFVTDLFERCFGLTNLSIDGAFSGGCLCQPGFVLALSLRELPRGRGHFRGMPLFRFVQRPHQRRVRDCCLCQPCLELSLPLRELPRRSRHGGCMTLFGGAKRQVALHKLLL